LISQRPQTDRPAADAVDRVFFAGWEHDVPGREL